MVLLQRRHLSAQRPVASQCCVIEQNGQKWAHARRACNCCLLGSSLECAAHDRRFSTCSTVRHQAGIHKVCAHYYSTLAQTMPQQQHGTFVPSFSSRLVPVATHFICLVLRGSQQQMAGNILKGSLADHVSKRATSFISNKIQQANNETWKDRTNTMIASFACQHHVYLVFWSVVCWPI